MAGWARLPAAHQPFEEEAHSGPVVDRASMLPIGQYEDGSLTLAWPGFLKDMYEGAVRSYEQGRHLPRVDDQGFYAGTPRAEPLDAFNAASIAPMAGVAGRVTGVIPKGALGSGGSDMRRASATMALGPEYIYKHVGDSTGGVISREHPSSALYTEGIGEYTLPTGSPATLTATNYTYRNAPNEVGAWVPRGDEWMRVGRAKVGNRGELEHVVVSPEYQRMGLGEHLARELVRRYGADPLGADEYTDAGAALANKIAGQPLESAGLPMDQASRLGRAQGMGFYTDKVYYHGTTGRPFADSPPADTPDIFSFQPRQPVDGGGTRMGAAGVYVSPDPQTANLYARSQYPEQAGAVYPLHTRAKIAPFDVAVRGGESTTDRVARLKREGYGGYSETGDGNQAVIFDPRDIRSVNAAFDPAKSNSSFLLAANPSTASLPSLLMNAEEGEDHRNPVDQFLRQYGLEKFIPYE